MATKKKAAAPRPRKSGLDVAKTGKPIMIDGHAYEIIALDTKKGLFDFARPDDQGPGDTKFLKGKGVIDDITQAEEGFLYLPNRVTPKVGDLVQAAVEAGDIDAGQAPSIVMAIRNHPLYPDRDDIAVRQVGEMYGLDLMQHVAVRDLIASED